MQRAAQALLKTGQRCLELPDVSRIAATAVSTSALASAPAAVNATGKPELIREFQVCVHNRLAEFCHIVASRLHVRRHSCSSGCRGSCTRFRPGNMQVQYLAWQFVRPMPSSLCLLCCSAVLCIPNQGALPLRHSRFWRLATETQQVLNVKVASCRSTDGTQTRTPSHAMRPTRLISTRKWWLCCLMTESGLLSL